MGRIGNLPAISNGAKPCALENLQRCNRMWPFSLLSTKTPISVVLVFSGVSVWRSVWAA